PRGLEPAGFVGGLAGRPPADRALAQLLLGSIVGLLLNVDLDQLPSDLVSQGTGDVLQFRELGASGQTVGINFTPQLPSDLAPAGLKLIPDRGNVLTHFRGPLQVAGQTVREPQTSCHTITPTP